MDYDNKQDSIRYSWDEFRSRAEQEKLIVLDNCVYNVKNWLKRHPGGGKIIGNFIGQDATESWLAMHPDKEKARKFLKPLLVCRLKEPNKENKEIKRDFEELRQQCEREGLFKTKPSFFIMQFLHIVFLEVMAYLIMLYLGYSQITFLIVATILAISQAQAGWSQHDYGHLSVCKTSLANHFMHQIVIGHIKAASSHWWNFHHFLHHTKPNVFKKDPDITVPYLFLMGDSVPRKWGKQKRGFMPYNQQHNYFWLFGPALLLPLFFHILNIKFVIRRRDYKDILMMVSFFTRFFFCYAPLLGGWGSFTLYMTVRFIESHWFTLVTQMNHIPMPVQCEDNDRDWLTAQTRATCNVRSTAFNDWFTGHLNFQIEHHLFPTMPRHNYHKVSERVRLLCHKHGLSYICKPLSTAIFDIYRSLKKSGTLWYDAYYS